MKKDLVVFIDLVNLQRRWGLSYKVLFSTPSFQSLGYRSIDDERKEGNMAKYFPSSLIFKTKEFFWLLLYYTKCLINLSIFLINTPITKLII